MWILTWIDAVFSMVWWISEFCYDAYVEIGTWGWPWNYLLSTFYQFHITFKNFLTPIAHFYDWVYSVIVAMEDIVTFDNLWVILATPLQWAADAWAWVSDYFNNVWSVVEQWWLTTYTYVEDWIETARQGLLALIDNVTAWVADLQSSMDDLIGRIPSMEAVITWFGAWWGNVLSVVNSWWTTAILQVVALINTAFIERDDWWAGWRDWRDQVIEFFTDPVEFVWQKFTDWFLGPEV